MLRPHRGLRDPIVGYIIINIKGTTKKVTQPELNSSMT